MNSSLPNFLATPAATPAAGASLLNTNALASLPSASSGDATAGALPEFAALMPPLPAALAPTATQTATVAAPTMTVVATIAAPSVITGVQAQSWSRPAPGPVSLPGSAVAEAMADRDGLLAPAPRVEEGSALPVSVSLSTALTSRNLPATVSLEAASPLAEAAETLGIVETTSVPSPREVPATLREQAVAFAVTLLQSLLPEVAVPVGGELAHATNALSENHAGSNPVGQPISAPCTSTLLGYSRSETGGAGVSGQLARPTDSAPRAGRGADASLEAPTTVMGQPMSAARASSQPANVQDTQSIRAAAGFEVARDVPALPADQPEIAALLADETVASAFAVESSFATATPDFTLRVPELPAVTPPAASREAQFDLPVALAPDGAVELQLDLPPAVVEAVQALQAETLEIGATPIAIHATLELPGQPVLRIEVGETAAAVVPDAPAPAFAQRENFAGKKRTAKAALETGATPVERNFEFTGSKQVKPRSPVAGIPVAKNDTIMSAAPTEEPRAARSPQDSTVLPVRAEFQVAQTSTERITVPAPGPSGQTFAARAVETVTGLVEAQFSASMQKSGSVHLRLKFGGEDLSVRVAIRDGAVHTDFHTDSAPLRAALEREWSAVAAASPEQMQRYAEPVFGPVTAAPAEAQPSFARASSQQAQPDAQQQQRAPREDAHPFNRRSLMSESFVPEPPAPRVATFLPTSLRLSALA